MSDSSAVTLAARRWRGLLMREIRENRSLMLYAPCLLVLVAILLGLRLFTLFPVERQTAAMDLLFNRFEGINALEIAPLLTSAGALNLVFIVGIALSYLASSLYADRRELSYLFWQSMPISDRATVMSKVATSVLVIPAIYLAILTVGSMFLIIGAAVYSYSLGIELNGLVELVATMCIALGFVGLSAVTAMLWLLPAVGWILLFSAYATRVPLLWAIGGLVALSLLEEVALGSNTLDTWIASRSSPWQYLVFSLDDLGARLFSYDMLFGAVLGGMLISGAILMRRFAD